MNFFLGKHCTIRAPYKTGTQFFNHKKTYSVVLLAVCDSKFRFSYINVGGFGSESDGGIFKNSNLGICLENGTIPLPDPIVTHHSRTPIPFVLLGDAAFPLKKNLMTPYSGQDLEDDKYLYNKELARGRATIENSFGVLAARWQIFHTSITAEPTTVDDIIKCTVVLHNYLTDEGSKYINREYIDHEINGILVEGHWRRDIPPGGTLLQPLPEPLELEPRNATQEAVMIRDEIKRILSNSNLNCN